MCEIVLSYLYTFMKYIPKGKYVIVGTFVVYVHNKLKKIIEYTIIAIMNIN